MEVQVLCPTRIAEYAASSTGRRLHREAQHTVSWRGLSSRHVLQKLPSISDTKEGLIMQSPRGNSEALWARVPGLYAVSSHDGPPAACTLQILLADLIGHLTRRRADEPCGCAALDDSSDAFREPPTPTCHGDNGTRLLHCIYPLMSLMHSTHALRAGELASS